MPTLRTWLGGSAGSGKSSALKTIVQHIRLLFQKALGSEYNIGITCLEDMGYDAEEWYIYSEGVRVVISELIAYTYAKLFFYP